MGSGGWLEEEKYRERKGKFSGEREGCRGG